MNCILNLVILSLLLVAVKSSSGPECNSSGIICISCTDYQNCTAGAPKGEIVSCKNGKACADFSLMNCWLELNCYDANECSKVGIFPNVISESDYFVCLGDAASGYIKYEFSCQEDNFFDSSVSMCLPKAATQTATETSLATDTTLVSSASDTNPTVTDSISTSTSTTTQTPGSSTSTTTQTPGSSTSTTTQTPGPSTSTTTQTPGPSTSTTTQTTQTPGSSTSTTTPDFTRTSGTSSTSTSTPIPPSSPPTETPLGCISPGIFANPTNCKMYYRCSTSLKIFHYTCPGTSLFNENILKCSMIITPACQEQILRNSSTTPTATTTTTPSPPPPTTTSPRVSPLTTTTTTTPPPPPPTTSTTTTTPSPPLRTTPSTTTSKPFSCPMAGTFENPLDCKTYFRCSSSGKPFLYTCPNSSYFNELTKRCSLVVTPRCESLMQG